MIVGQEKPSLDQLAHFGIKGMRWGFRKQADITAYASKSTAQKLATDIRREAGYAAAKHILKTSGRYALPAAKGAIKGTIFLAKYGFRTAKGAKTAIRILGVAGKYGFRFGKSYARGVVKIAQIVR